MFKSIKILALILSISTSQMFSYEPSSGTAECISECTQESNRTSSEAAEKKFTDETANIVQGFLLCMYEIEASPIHQIIYTTEKYGSFAVSLTKFKQMMDSSKQAIQAVNQTIQEVGYLLGEEVLLDLMKIFEKKKKLEKLSIILDESEKKEEWALSYYKTWLSESSDIDERSRKFLLKTHYEQVEKYNSFRTKEYLIRKKFIKESLQLLNFLSGIYGTYEKGKDLQVLFANEEDAHTFNGHMGNIANLTEADIKISTQCRQYLEFVYKPNPYRIQQQGLNVAKELKTIFEWFTNIETARTPRDSFHTVEEYGYSAILLDRFQKFMKLVSQEGIILEQAENDINLESSYTDYVFFDLTKIHESKKKLENLCIKIDEAMEKLEKYRSELLQWMLSKPYLKEYHKNNIIEGFTTPEAFNSMIAHKNVITEYANLMDFLSIKYGTYKIAKNAKKLIFSSKADRKVYKSYIKRINNLFDKLRK